MTGPELILDATKAVSQQLLAAAFEMRGQADSVASVAGASGAGGARNPLCFPHTKTPRERERDFFYWKKTVQNR